MSCVHYKFKSAVNVETITFDGMHISVADLKKAIIQQKKMGKLMENFDLQLSKPQSFDVYKDTDLIPKNSSVIVARIPVERTKSRSWDSSRVDMSTAMSLQKAEANAQDKLQRSADLVNMKGSEEEKVKLMMLQSGKEYSQANYIRPRYPTGPPPRNYVCHRCGQPGHFINACPNRDDGDMTHRLKRSTGIPNSFMTPVVDPNVPGVLMTNTGQLAVPKIDAIAYMQGKKEKPPFVKSDSPERKQDEKIIPGELLCPVCKDLLTDAVVAPCCGNSACDECIRDALIDSDEHVCPICKESGISPDALIPNKFMRTAVNNFQNETGYTTVKRRNQQEIPPQQPAPATVSKPEVERQSIALPPHLVGMPPQVIKAELASKEIHGPGTPSSGLQHTRDTSFAIESGSAAHAIPGGYAIQRTSMTPRLQTVVRTAPYSVVHRQSPAVGSDVIMSHAPTNLVQMSQGKHGDSPLAPPGAYLDEHGIMHQTPHARPRLIHPSVRQWPHGPGLRGSILIHSRGGHRMTLLRPSSVGPRRLPLPPPPGDSHFSASVPEHGFPPSAAVGLVNQSPMPGPLPPQGMPGRVPQQQPPSQNVPGMIRIPAPLHPSGPPQQIIYSRLPPPSGPVSRLMGQEMIMTPPQGFIPPLMPTANANMPPPVPLTEEEFYREKERLLELERKRKGVDSVEATVGRKKVDPMDDFEELLQKKSRPKGVSLYHTSKSRSRSRTRSLSRSYTKSRSRSRSMKKRSRSLSRSRSRSPVKSPLRRTRSITRSRTRSRSRSRPFLRSKTRSRSRYASRKKSFTPKRSFTPVRRYSRTRSRTPLPKRPRSRSFTKSPRPRSRTRSRSPVRPLKRISRSLSRSVSRSPLPSKRQPRSRSPASRGRSPHLPPTKRYQRRSLSPRGRSMERSHGKPPPRYPPRDSAAHRYSPDRPRSGYKSSPHYDDRGYYRYPDKYDPRWTEYYRMLQDWYAKYDNFAHGLPSGYEPFGRLHSRGLPRSRSRSHTPRPPKRSHSPDDPAKWKRERSPKRMRLDARDKSRTGRYEKDDVRRSSDVNRDKERRKDARPVASKSEKERSGTAGVDSDRFQHTPNKSDRRRGEDEEIARSRNHDRDDSRQQPRNKVDARDNRPESGGRKMTSKPLWDDRAEKTESHGKKAVSKSSRDHENSEPREESSKIPVIGASATVERRHSIGQTVIGDNQSSVGENLRVVKEEPPKEDKRTIKEEPPCEPVKEEQPKEIKQISNVGHVIKKDKVARDSVDQELEHKSKEPEVEWKAKDKEVPKPKIEEPVVTATTTKAPRRREGSCGSDADRPVQHQSRSSKKSERPAVKEAPESGRKAPDRQHAKARPSPSVEDVLYANIPSTSKWEKNQSDSDTEIPQPRWTDQEKDRTSSLPRSVLESAENAVRHKPRSSVLSSVCSPPLPRSSIQRISAHSEPSQQTKKSVKEKKASKDDKYQDVSSNVGRKVVQGPTSLSMKVTVSSNAKDSKEGKKGEKSSRGAEKYATPPSPVNVREVKRSISCDGRRNKDRNRGERSSTHREEDGKFSRKESHESGMEGNPSASSAKKDEPSKKTSGIRDRKASVFVDEDKFEPDYNESGSSDYEGSVQAADKGYHNSQSDSRRQESSSEAEEVKSKQKKKHKKHKKLKKHKTKSRKEDK